MTFLKKLNYIVKKNNSLVCVGLDSDITKIPSFLMTEKYPQFTFNKKIVDQTHDLVCGYKPNSAFYEARGDQGIKELKMTFDYLVKNYPEIPLILDAKRADIVNTNFGYLKYAFDYLNADAITVQPYLGQEAIQPFLDRKDKGIIVLCKTSNPGAGEFQDLKIKGRPLYEQIARQVINKWNTNHNCLLVVGATYPVELKRIRKIVGNKMWFLIPGIGKQGGDLEKTIKAGQNSLHNGLIINSSRDIIFASFENDFSQKAREQALKLKEDINRFRS